MSSDLNVVTDVEVLEHLENGDHNIIVWDLVCNVRIGKSKIPYRQYHNADYVAMKEWLSNIDWDIEFSDLDIDGLWSKFCCIIEKAIELINLYRYDIVNLGKLPGG